MKEVHTKQQRTRRRARHAVNKAFADKLPTVIDDPVQKLRGGLENFSLSPFPQIKSNNTNNTTQVQSSRAISKRLKELAS